MTKIKDTDYLFLSAKVRTMERNLLNRDRMEQMLEAHSDLDAVRVLSECGYPEMTEVNVDILNETLSRERDRVFKEISNYMPDPAIMDVFKIKYDYHNAKVILKAEALGIEGSRLFMNIGRVPAQEMADSIRSSEFYNMPPILKKAVIEAREVLGTTKDPRLADSILDQAYFEDMNALAEEAGSDFLQGYVRTSIDIANMRSIVRTARMGKGTEFLEGVLFAGGDVGVRRIVSVISAGGSVEDLYTTSTLKEAAEAGAAAARGSSLTRFEKLCDDALTNCISKAKYVAFGEAPIIAFLAAKENELTAVRIIMTGRLAGLSADTIRERLRESYV